MSWRNINTFYLILSEVSRRKVLRVLRISGSLSLSLSQTGFLRYTDVTSKLGHVRCDKENSRRMLVVPAVIYRTRPAMSVARWLLPEAEVQKNEWPTDDERHPLWIHPSRHRDAMCRDRIGMATMKNSRPGSYLLL